MLSAATQANGTPASIARSIIARANCGFVAAGHNLSDVLGLLVAWGAAAISKWAPTARYTYGMRRSSILAALCNAVFLLVAIGAIGWEAIQRLFEPAPVAGKTVMVVAAIGIVINGITAWLFASGRKGDINIRAAFLHMAADAVVSAGVVVAGLIILFTGWLWLDPAVSLLIVAVIFWSTWGLLRDSVNMSLDAVPPGIDRREVCGYLDGAAARIGAARPAHLAHEHDRNRAEGSSRHAGGHPGDEFILQTATELKRRFGIGHTTLQIEVSETTLCPLAPHQVV